MDYVSTRGRAPVLPFDDVLLAGLARDGGLYVPAAWPAFSAADWRAMAGLEYAALAARVMTPFVADTIESGRLETIACDAYAGFDAPDVAPLIDLGDGQWLMELFHGPTLAFKDYALQLVGRLFDEVLAHRGERITIVGATSGDTGSAAIEACRDRANLDIFILHPKGRVSDVQRRQMTTVDAENVHNIAIDGSFDDCQDLVKAMFNDTAFRDRLHLSAVNSINWGRVAAQIVYYVKAAVAVGAPERPVAFAVPTGNFGNVFAGYAAHRCGLPVAKLVVGSNRNDILPRFFGSARMALADVVPTLSPSMDIQVSSNFERLLFELYDRDGDAVTAMMTRLRAERAFVVEPERWRRALALFDAVGFDDAATTAEMGAFHGKTGRLVDPHTAIGLAAARACRGDRDTPMVVLATAHPAKFPDAVQAATGVRPKLPERLADLMDRRERVTELTADVEVVKDFVAAHATAARQAA